MELRLLGPFEICLDGTVRSVAGPAERAVLAVLALSVGRVVATTTLIDALWATGELPDDPGNALQLRVSKLRRGLGAHGAADVVRREGPGYRLALVEEDVDLHRFAAMIRVARRTGEAEPAVDAYDEALALWRAEPFVDFAGAPWTVVETARVSELRLSALAERAERLLTLGHYDRVVTELEPIVADVPTRERLTAQLMTALFNTGRQAEALDVFDRTRRVLAEDLGIDPSRELRQVMEQILRQDPAISPARPAPVASSRPVGGHRVGARGGLPLRATSFVGRDADLLRLSERLESARLVTLAGPGGAGKTTLGIETARACADTFRDGVVVVRLAAVSEPAMLTHAVADALGVGIEGGTASHLPDAVLVEHLRGRNTLMVLDNCEHLVEAVATLVETVLERCPEIRVIATSREALAVPGEVQIPVVPLPVPDPGSAPDEVLDFAAAQLFWDRALAVDPQLVRDDDTLVAVATICRRLDGLPLAMELAAARLATLSPTELAGRVEDRFALLTTGIRTADARQQTLRATVDWSHALLTEPERMLFRRLAVFRGGWTLEAAEGIVTGPELAPALVLDLLDRLVRQSLVVAEREAGQTRYRMLETLRQYATEELVTAGERDSLRDAHAQIYLALCERAEVGLHGSRPGRWTTMLTREHANIRAALTWFSTAAGQVERALQLAGSLGLYWHMGRHLEGRETLRGVLALPGGSPSARARAMQAVSLVERPKACIVHPSAQCAAAALNSLEIFEAAGDRARTALSRLLLAVECVGATSPDQATAQLARAELEFTELGDEWGRAVVAFVEMEACAKHGDEAGADAAAERAIGRFRALDNEWGLSGVLYHRGWGLARFGHLAEAVEVYEESITVAERAGVDNTVQWATADLGLTLLSLGRVEEASVHFSRAGAVSDRVGDDAGKALASFGVAVAAQQRGDHAAARPMFLGAWRALERIGVPLATGQALAGVAACDERTGDTHAARTEYGQLVRLAEETGELGLQATGLDGLARVALADGDSEEAGVLTARAESLRVRLSG